MLMTQRGARLQIRSDHIRRAPGRRLRGRKKFAALFNSARRRGMNVSAICSVFTEDGITSKIQNIAGLIPCFKAYGYKAFSRLLFGESWPLPPPPSPVSSRVSQRLPLTLCFFATPLSIWHNFLRHKVRVDKIYKNWTTTPVKRCTRLDKRISKFNCSSFHSEISLSIYCIVVSNVDFALRELTLSFTFRQKVSSVSFFIQFNLLNKFYRN